VKIDVAIVGAGPGGNAAALFLAQRGIRAALVEKQEFPRYHIGESLTGECGNCLRKLNLVGRMQTAGHPIKYGTRVYGPGGKNSFYVPVMARGEDGNLVEQATWQVRRSDFDAMLADEARERAVDVIRGEAVEPLREGEAVRGVRVRLESGDLTDIRSDVLVDASGMSTFLCRCGVTSSKVRGRYDNQVAIFSQVAGAVRDEGKERDNTLIFYKQRHHWAWFIPLDEQHVSVGVVVPADYFAASAESKRDFLLRELRELNAELSRRLPSLQLVEEVRAISNYSYHIPRFAGPGYLCVGDAHRFIDPVFSFGVYFAVKEAEIAAGAIEKHLSTPGGDSDPFGQYQQTCDAGMDVIQELIDGFWNEPLAFSVFVHSRYPEDFIDLFAGRVYDPAVSPGLSALRDVNRRHQESTSGMGA